MFLRLTLCDQDSIENCSKALKNGSEQSMINRKIMELFITYFFLLFLYTLQKQSFDGSAIQGWDSNLKTLQPLLLPCILLHSRLTTRRNPVDGCTFGSLEQLKCWWALPLLVQCRVGSALQYYTNRRPRPKSKNQSIYVMLIVSLPARSRFPGFSSGLNDNEKKALFFFCFMLGLNQFCV